MEGAEGALRVAIGDVSGKGVPAGLFMIMARTVLRSLATGDAPLDEVLSNANDTLESQIEDDKFTTLLLLEASADGRTVRTSLAGHEPPVLVRAGGEPQVLPEGGIALGMLPGQRARFEERVLRIGPGDVLACYSDGVTECRDRAGEFFGKERLLRALREAAPRGADATLRHVQEELARFRGGAERSDDVTLVVLEALP
jgi:sigma-B regulation protein RsbU (phosphoserine phosphatase)